MCHRSSFEMDRHEEEREKITDCRRGGQTHLHHYHLMMASNHPLSTFVCAEGGCGCSPPMTSPPLRLWNQSLFLHSHLAH